MKPHPDQRFGSLTYAQHGDDLLILSIFDRLKIPKPFYVDIGAHHPSIISNTKLLYDRGARGVNVDANVHCKAAFAEERPHDINLIGVAIAPVEGHYDFHIYGSRSGRNTLSGDEVQSLQGILKVERVEKVRAITYEQLIKDHCGGRVPDLLSIDVEGLDIQILDSADFKRLGFPKVICVETRIPDTKLMIKLLRDYTIYCRMGENLFFIRDDCFGAVIGFAEED